MTDPEPRHRVYMYFQDRHGWHCQFLEADLRTSLPRTLSFATADKVIELVQRGAGLPDLASRQALDQVIANGRGGVFLDLNEKQYAQLLTPALPRGNREIPQDS